MRLFYDCEFVDDGRTIDLISIGMIREDGDALYCINGDDNIIDRAASRPWLADNVLPHLPLALRRDGDAVTHIRGYGEHRGVKSWSWDPHHPDWAHVRPRKYIAHCVRSFIFNTPAPPLWAWFGAYDHVALAQLFGSMVDLPFGIPMWTNDLKQEAVRLGDPQMPPQDPTTAHHALQDAKHDFLIARHLDALR